MSALPQSVEYATTSFWIGRAYTARLQNISPQKGITSSSPLRNSRTGCTVYTKITYPIRKTGWKI